MSKTIATLVGCAIGDALGNPFEMKPAISPLLKEWDGQFKAGGTFWKGEAGQYTDDTLMSIALSKSLLQCNGFDPDDVAKEYLAWYDTGNTRGIGTTTASAMVNLKLGANYKESGLIVGYDGLPAGGNGTAMRASPIGLVYRHDLTKLMECAIKDASITHNSMEPKIGSVVVAITTALLATGVSSPKSLPEDILDIIPDSIIKTKLELASKWAERHTPIADVSSYAFAEIGVSGYVPETVGAALFCFSATRSFQEAVVMAVRAGGDTDTTAAIVGALAGTYYGLEGIPEEYKNQVENFELLQGLTDELLNIEIQ
jgi:ADP-ribosyl-[dinitrogen reductase] hydrolase